ncbi:nuclear transport factor 2 family protein [Nocardia sp. NPDC049220]|uniref:nuclear transport factor 2 family protein n=1 Tax=Nocardia sp. NPDC049220 TaxID=3155273 RepID=UPI0033C6441E
MEDLIIRYASLIDAGDLAALASLFADATFATDITSVRGSVAVVEEQFRDLMITYADGTPRTKHVITNILVDVDEQAGTAAAQAYYTLLQALPELPLQIIAAGRYRDRFARRDGEWHFVERHLFFDLVGDLSRHPRIAAPVSGASDTA